MLSTKNRRLKRLSRFMAFFVIIVAGSFYRLNQYYENFKKFSSADEFIEESDMVPPVIRELNGKRKDMERGELPAEDKWEVQYKLHLNN